MEPFTDSLYVTLREQIEDAIDRKDAKQVNDQYVLLQWIEARMILKAITEANNQNTETIIKYLKEKVEFLNEHINKFDYSDSD